MLKSTSKYASCNNAMLLTLLSQHDQEVFRFLYNHYNQRILKIALRYLKSENVAQEVVQDVFMKLWMEREKIKEGTPIEAWLYTVAKNNTINRLKRMAHEWKLINHLKATQSSSDNSTTDKIKDNDGRNVLNDALKTLSENQFKVYQMARHENLSYIQIAKQLNISPLTVKTHMSRALGHLKLIINKY